MEFEIINEILTSTVSSLFPNSARHLSYFKIEDGENIRTNDIPKSK
jgi:hypothetical protein